MEYEKWRKIYTSIIEDFGFCEEKDKEAAVILDELLCKRDVSSQLKRLENSIRDREVIVFGAGDSLCKGIERFRDLIEKSTKIAADGATSALIEKGIVPDVIVTDLDGRLDDIIAANRKGSIVVVHAHGDNIEKIKTFIPRLKGVIGTTQTDPRPFRKLFNFGGFTDGDRAVFLADHFRPKVIYLMGFDFNGKVGKYSFTEKEKVTMKLKKLAWCRRLLREVSRIVFLMV